MSKKKVLIITEPFKYGGMDLVALRLQQALDNEKFECVYCVRHDKERGPLDDYVRSTGVRVIYQPEDESSYLKSYKFYLNLLKNEHFDIVHSHFPFYSALPMLAAYKCSVKVRISHSHFTYQVYNKFSKIKQILVNIYRVLMRKIISRYSTCIIGCSVQAGEYLAGKNGFAKKGVVLNNGIDLTKYEYSPKIRSRVREKLGLQGKIVLGHIGMLYYIKNQMFLLDVFSEFQKQYSNSVLMIIGDGEDREKLENRCKELNICDKVIFTGLRNDISDLLMAMDCMVFPSLHEGFPLTLVEAQASKLPCLVSSSVTEKTKLNSNVSFLSLSDSLQKWIDEIYRLIQIDREKIDTSSLQEEFDIYSCAKKLEEIYLSK